MKKAVRENAHFGAKVIKIVVDPYPQSYLYSVDDIRYIVAEAASSGLKVAAHATSDKGARNAAEGGVASIEHGYEMSDETLEITKRNHVMLVTCRKVTITSCYACATSSGRNFRATNLPSSVSSAL